MKPTFRSRGVREALCALLALPAIAAAQPVAPFPLQPGEAVLTCFSGASDGFVLAVVDVRDPEANAPGTNRHWPAPAYHAPNWTRAHFDGNEVFGIALDDAPNPNIYVTSSSSYDLGQLASGKVFKIDGTTGAVSVFAELPNCNAFPVCPGTSYAGLGNIAFDRDHGQFFVTNFYDGKIYRLSRSGAVLGTFDPFAPFDPAHNSAEGFAPLGERLWGVGVHAGRVYFGVWSSDYRPGPANTVWSVALDAAGAFSGAAAREIDPPPTGTGLSMPVADVEFTVEGRMLLAERTMIKDTVPGSHQARVLEFVGGPGAWVPSGRTFAIGRAGTANAAGGVDSVCEEDRTTHVVVTGDSLHVDPDDFIFGLQIFPATGGSVENSYLIDVDGDLTQPAKTLLGDVDVHCAAAEPPGPLLPDYDVILNTGWNEDLGRLIKPGNPDDDWRAGTGAGAPPAFIVVNRPALWRPVKPTAHWLSADVTGRSNASPSGTTTRYEYCFCIGPDATTAMVMFKYYADESATVSLNGQVIAGPGGQFRRSSPVVVDFETEVGHGPLRHGDNCMTVDVFDRGFFSGFSLHGMIWITHGACAAAP